jgi:catechol 2,3-dioxygenase-like lactoylglutathione lyase family enzyme
MRSLAVALTCALVATAVHAQAPAVPASPGPSPTGLVVGSGSFFSPIVSDLDRAVAFYRDGLGLDVQGAPTNADTNPALRNMFGLPDAQLRWQIGRPAGMRSGVEIVEIKKAGGNVLERRLQDIGATTLIVLVRDLDSVFERLKQLGAPVVSKGGRAPVRARRRAQVASGHRPGSRRALRGAVPARSAAERDRGARTPVRLEFVGQSAIGSGTLPLA